jgi:hypothetical protein
MDRSRIRKAGKLLSKAESTDSDAEAHGLALHAYRLLAAQLNEWESMSESAGGFRRRERRLMRDRRATAADPRAEGPVAKGSHGESGRRFKGAYRKFDGTEEQTGQIDLSL